MDENVTKKYSNKGGRNDNIKLISSLVPRLHPAFQRCTRKTFLPFFSCNVEKLCGAWGRGYCAAAPLNHGEPKHLCSCYIG